MLEYIKSLFVELNVNHTDAESVACALAIENDLTFYAPIIAALSDKPEKRSKLMKRFHDLKEAGFPATYDYCNLYYTAIEDVSGTEKIVDIDQVCKVLRDAGFSASVESRGLYIAAMGRAEQADNISRLFGLLKEAGFSTVAANRELYHAALYQADNVDGVIKLLNALKKANIQASDKNKEVFDKAINYAADADKILRVFEFVESLDFPASENKMYLYLMAIQIAHRANIDRLKLCEQMLRGAGFAPLTEYISLYTAAFNNEKNLEKFSQHFEFLLTTFFSPSAYPYFYFLAIVEEYRVGALPHLFNVLSEAGIPANSENRYFYKHALSLADHAATLAQGFGALREAGFLFTPENKDLYDDILWGYARADKLGSAFKGLEKMGFPATAEFRELYKEAMRVSDHADKFDRVREVLAGIKFPASVKKNIYHWAIQMISRADNYIQCFQILREAGFSGESEEEYVLYSSATCEVRDVEKLARDFQVLREAHISATRENIGAYNVVIHQFYYGHELGRIFRTFIEAGMFWESHRAWYADIIKNAGHSRSLARCFDKLKGAGFSCALYPSLYRSVMRHPELVYDVFKEFSEVGFSVNSDNFLFVVKLLHQICDGIEQHADGLNKEQIELDVKQATEGAAPFALVGPPAKAIIAREFERLLERLAATPNPDELPVVSRDNTKANLILACAKLGLFGSTSSRGREVVVAIQEERTALSEGPK